MNSYDRYSQFRQNGEISIVPFGSVPKKESDLYYTYRIGVDRLDLISYKYYGDANYGWLIMQANPEHGSMEYSIPDGTNLRIPYPLSESISDYRNSIDIYNKLYNN